MGDKDGGECPRCGGVMSDYATGSNKNLKRNNRYSECPDCGYWVNRYSGKVRMTRMVLDHPLNFDNEDGWPCR